MHVVSRAKTKRWESQAVACSEFGWQSLAANLERDSLVSPHPEQRSFPLHRVVLEKESLTWVACPGISYVHDVFERCLFPLLWASQVERCEMIVFS